MPKTPLLVGIEVLRREYDLDLIKIKDKLTQTGKTLLVDFYGIKWSVA